MKKGFTLIELLIVITIIGILAVAFLPSVLGAPSKARDTQRLAVVQKIAAAAQAGSVNGVFSTSGCVMTGGSNLGGVITVENFGGNFPNDPQGTNSTGINATCKGGYGVIIGAATSTYSFAVYARMENASQGNIVCPTVANGFDFSAADKSAVLTSGTVAITAPSSTGAATDTNCYAVAVQ
jgi:prepilin-type N-terminal cleavage/methylation domain-containing protein